MSTRAASITGDSVAKKHLVTDCTGELSDGKPGKTRVGWTGGYRSLELAKTMGPRSENSIRDMGYTASMKVQMYGCNPIPASLTPERLARRELVEKQLEQPAFANDVRHHFLYSMLTGRNVATVGRDGCSARVTAQHNLPLRRGNTTPVHTAFIRRRS